MNSNLHCVPVVFFDGHRSHNLGSVNTAFPVSFVSLQTIISRSLSLSLSRRVPSQQFSMWLVRPTEAGTVPRYSAQPIGETTDISAAVRTSGGDCYVLAAPRSSLPEGPTSRELRMGIWDYERMVAAAAAAGSTMGVRMLPKATWMNTNGSENAMAARCTECEAARRDGKSLEFHHCVNDRVKVGFELRPAAGPIERPKKM